MSSSLFEVSLYCEDKSTDLTTAPSRFVISSTLQDLIEKASKAYGVIGQLVNSRGTVIESDEVLLLLHSTKVPLFFRVFRENRSAVVNRAGPTGFQSLNESIISTPELLVGSSTLLPMTGLNVDALSDCQSLNDDVAGREKNFLESDGCDTDEDREDLSFTNRKAHEALLGTDLVDGDGKLKIKDFFPLPSIINSMRKGIRGVNSSILMARVEKVEMCSEADEKLILHSAGTWLMKNCKDRKEFYPSPEELFKMSKSMVAFFPSMRNRASKSTPWDIIYDIRTRKGILEGYIRNKRCREEKSAKRSKPAYSKKQRLSSEETFSAKEVETAERFMRENFVDKNNKIQMLHFLNVTRKCRRDMALGHDKSNPTILLNRFPLLLHLNEAIQEDLEAITGVMFPDIQFKWNKVEALLFVEAEKALKSVAGKQLVKTASEAKDEFRMADFSICVLELLLHLLPNNNKKEMVKAVKTSDCLDLMFRRFEIGTPFEQVLAETRNMIQPGIILIGSVYFIKIENLHTQLKKSNLTHALAYLLAFYFVLNIDYPKPLKFVFSFFESLFDLPSSNESVIVKRLVSKVVENT